MSDNIPRSAKQYLNVPAEIAIQKAVDEVEKLGADKSLTDAIIYLQKAKNIVSNHVDQLIKQ